MKKRIIVCLLAGLIAISGMLSGCGGRHSQKAQEYKELGISQLEDAAYEDAVDSFQKALDQSVGQVGAEEIDICYYKALAQFKEGDMEGAIETYTALIKFDKKNWEVYYLRGSAYLQNDQKDLCLKDYEQAVSLNEKDYELYTHIYESLASAGYEKKGQEYLKKALELKPSSEEDYAGIGYAYFLMEDYENAEKNLKKSVDDGYDKALLALGQVYAADGKSDEAKSCFEKYMEKYPKDAEALNELGEIALGAEEYPDAETYFENALQAAGRDSEQDIWRNLIIACEYAGDFDKALEEAQEYMLDYPKDEEMQKECEFLKTRVSDRSDKESEDDKTNNSEDDGENTN